MSARARAEYVTPWLYPRATLVGTDTARFCLPVPVGGFVTWRGPAGCAEGTARAMGAGVAARLVGRRVRLRFAHAAPALAHVAVERALGVTSLARDHGLYIYEQPGSDLNDFFAWSALDGWYAAWGLPVPTRLGAKYAVHLRIVGVEVFEA